jgi:hypothetical protein
MSLEKITSWKEPPNHDRITQFKCIHNVEDKVFIIWQMGTLLNGLAFPRVWCYFEYWDDDSRERAAEQLRFTTGLLNGIRQPSEIVAGLREHEQSDG